MYTNILYNWQISEYKNQYFEEDLEITIFDI